MRNEDGAGKMEVLTIIFSAARGAFLDVGVWVALMLLAFGYFEYRTAGRLIGSMREYRKWQPIMGATLGVVPGCGGAIFIMPLFVNRTVSFGTVVATLVATVGDSSWILIVSMPRHALLIHAVSFLTGIVTGYLVDALKIGANLLAEDRAIASLTRRYKPEKHRDEGMKTAGYSPSHCLSSPRTQSRIEPLEGTKHMEPLHAQSHIRTGRWFYYVTHRFYIVLWGVFLVGFIVSFFTQLRILTSEEFDALFGGMPVYSIVGIGGTMLCLAWMAFSHKSIADDTHEEVEEKLQSRREMLIHNGAETAFVTVWVAAAYIIFELFMYFTGIDLKAIVDQAGILAVIAAAAVGLIPGCGPQIIITSMYIKGILPFAAIIAHAISQDGDALFPLLALHPRAALLATVVTTFPALAIGGILYLSGLGL
jgi:hypothetical protein